MAMLMSEIYDRRTSEKRRPRHLLGLAIDLNTAETNVLQKEEVVGLIIPNRTPPHCSPVSVDHVRPVVATMEGLADQLATVGPKPSSVVDDTEDLMFDLKAQESTLQDVLLGRNRGLEAQESQEEDQNRSLGGMAGASLEFQKSYLLRRIKAQQVHVGLVGLHGQEEGGSGTSRTSLGGRSTCSDVRCTGPDYFGCRR
ncbi:unnamed protein product [Ectocarpus sp. 13 AM-2016]